MMPGKYPQLWSAMAGGKKETHERTNKLLHLDMFVIPFTPKESYTFGKDEKKFWYKLRIYIPNPEVCLAWDTKIQEKRVLEKQHEKASIYRLSKQHLTTSM